MIYIYRGEVKYCGNLIMPSYLSNNKQGQKEIHHGNKCQGGYLCFCIVIISKQGQKQRFFGFKILQSQQRLMSSNKPYMNKYARKQNYETLNLQHQQSLSPLRAPYANPQDLSNGKRTLQQKQIQDLQQKVDIILEHNDKLSFQNQELKHRLADIQMEGLNNLQKERLSRYQLEDNQYGIRKLKSQIQIHQRECEILIHENASIKQINKKEIESLRSIIDNLNINNEELKIQNYKLGHEIQKTKEMEDNDRKFMIKEMERKMQEDVMKMGIEKEQELIRERGYHSKILEELKAKFQQQKVEFNNRKGILINKLQDTHNKEINELRDQMMAQFNQEVLKLQEESLKKCKNQRDKADDFIKEMMNNMEGYNPAQNQLLKNQINNLQISLKSRKNVIEQLLKNQLNQEITFNQFQEVKQLRKRLKEQTEHLMRENEILKIRLAERYENDFKEMVKIYENKIEVLTKEIKIVHDQNDRIRLNYQEEVEVKIKQRRTWEQEVGRLKNLIRKLKVQMQGINDDFRINIDFIKDQNATFSMNLMKSMVQVKDNANFFEEQNRKLRLMYEKHEKDVQLEKKQADQKVKFYESKNVALKNALEQEKYELAEKQETIEKILNDREERIMQTLRNERLMMQNKLTEMQNQRLKYQRQYLQARNKLQDCEYQLRDANSQIEQLIIKGKENEEHIERLRMELQMAGVDDRQKHQAINQWKDHYENIITSLQSDKVQLKAINQSFGGQLQKWVYRYHLLQNQLAKGTESLQKRGDLDKRVIQLGMDENLIKNVGEIWKKDHHLQ